MNSTLNRSGQGTSKSTIKSVTKLGGGSTKTGYRGNITNKKSTMKGPTSYNTSERMREDDPIMVDGKNVRPKPLVFTTETVAQDLAPAADDNTQGNPTTTNKGLSMLDSTFKQTSSMEKSSDKQITSSMMESKQSDYTENSEDSSSRAEGHEARKKRKEKAPEFNPEEDIIIHLGETETTTLFFMPSYTIATESPLHPVFQKRNQDYEKLCKIKIGSDNFSNRAAQTLNQPQRYKDIVTVAISTTEAGVHTSEHMIEDSKKEEHLNVFDQNQVEVKSLQDKEMDTTLKQDGCLISTDLKVIKVHSKNKYGIQNAGSRVDNRSGKIEESKGETSSSFSRTMTHTHTMGQPREERTLGGQGHNTSAKLNTGTTKLGGGQTSLLAGNTTKGGGTTKLSNQTMEVIEGIKEQQEENKGPVYTEEEAKALLNENMPNSMKFMERILNQSKFHKQYVTYRNYPEVRINLDRQQENEGKKMLGFPFGRGLARAQAEKENAELAKNRLNEKKPLNNLLTFKCDLTKNRTVSSADWNPVNLDLLAASYGECDLSPDREGYVMFWTLKNPNYPEKIIRLPSRALSCRFSTNSPNLLSTSLYNGVVAIYDIRTSCEKPVVDSSKLLPGKHLDAVWEVQWVGKGSGSNAEKGEDLVSISSDGRVVQWSIKKGLEYTDLMSLKRVANPTQREENIEAMNFRPTAGFSFDFLKGEGSTYLASTEDGTIHKCSKSYTEQYLDNYFGHTGSVYKVRSNPFKPDYFLSCSADWSCRLWNIKEEQQKSVFQSLDLFDEVMDIEWSPLISTMFASVARDGRLELWDLYKNVLDPIATDKPNIPKDTPKDQLYLYGRKTVKFSPVAPILVTGDFAGDINIFKLMGFDDIIALEPSSQIERFNKAIDGMSTNKAEKEVNADN